MALTKILPSGLDSTQNYTVNTITANTVVSNGVNLFTFANAAFTAANNASDSWVRNQANAAFIQANAGFTQSNTYVWPAANSAGSYANAAFTKANSAVTLGKSIAMAIIFGG